jgi:hypothetical protein
VVAPVDVSDSAPESVIVFAENVSVPTTVPLAKVPTPPVVILVVFPIMRSPALLMVNFVAPLFDAVKRSPSPVLSTVKAAYDVEPDTEAVGAVPLVLNLNFAEVDAELPNR